MSLHPPIQQKTPAQAQSLRKKKQMDQAQLNFKLCTECGAREVVINEREGTAVCKRCGSVKEYSMIDETAEWRNMGDGPSTQDRTGGATNANLESYGIEGTITGNNEDEKFMKNASKRFMTTADRNIKMGMVILKEFATQLNLTKNCKEIAMELYSASEKKSILRGKSYEAKLTACIYMACKIACRPKSLRDLLAILRVKRKDVTKCYKVISQTMPSAKMDTNYAEKVSILCRELEIPDVIERACRD